MRKWLFFDLGSTLIDETLCLEYRTKHLLDQVDASGREEVLSVLQKMPYRQAAEHLSLKTTEWPSHLEMLYPETKDTISNLHTKYRLGIIANQNAGAKQRLEVFGIREYFQVVVTSAELGFAKPDPRIFREALRKAGCSASQAYMIGDRLNNDIEPAKKLGFATIWVKQGMGASGHSGDIFPDYTVNSLQEILGIL